MAAWECLFTHLLMRLFFQFQLFFLQISISLFNPQSALWYATLGYIACLLGTPIGYLIGRIIGKKVLNLLLKQEWIDKASNMFKRNGESAILIGSFTPIPFKVFTILSGSLEFSLLKLLLFAAIGRAFKFYAVGILFHFYGSSAKYFIDHYLTQAFLGVALILTLVIVIKRRIQHKKSLKLMMAENSDTSGKHITNTGEPTLPN